MYLVVDTRGRPCVTSVHKELYAACDEADRANARKGAASTVVRLPELLEEHIAKLVWEQRYGSISEDPIDE